MKIISKFYEPEKEFKIDEDTGDLLFWDDYYHRWFVNKDYTKSLDSLIPVWDKINEEQLTHSGNLFCISESVEKYGNLYSTLQEAAAIATAITIEGLGKVEKV